MTRRLTESQMQAVGLLDTGKILIGRVGSGKSTVSLGYVFRKWGGKSPVLLDETWEFPVNATDLYIITTAKKRDSLEWESEALHYHLSKDPETSCTGRKLVVDSWNNIEKYVAVEGATFIFDEQRVVGYGKWAKSFIKIAKHNDWLLLSATPGDTWHDYVPVFIANGFFKHKTDFEEQHVVWDRFAKYPKVKQYIGTRTLHEYRKRILVDMDDVRGTRRIREERTVEFDRKALKEVNVKRWNPFTDAPIKQASEYVAVVRRIVNSDRSRYEALMAWIEEHPRTIVFYNYDFELEILRGLRWDVPGLTVAEWNGHLHESVPVGDKWVYLVQYTAGAEGWNCVTTDSMVMYSLNYSWRIMEQAEGRIDRMNSPYEELRYLRLVSESAIDGAIRKALDDKQKFNEKAFASVRGF